MMMMKRMMSVVAAAVILNGCLDDGGAGRGVKLTQAQLAEQLASGDLRLEVELRADGSVREVHIESEGPGHEAHFAGRVVSVDAASSTLEVEHLGTVDFAGAGRFRTERDSRVERGAWLVAVEGALAGGQAVWLDARGRFGETRFVASELRWEDDAEREIEADVRGADFDVARGVLRVAWLTFDLRGAEIRMGDDSDDGDDDSDDGDDDSDDGDDDVRGDSGSDDREDREVRDGGGDAGPTASCGGDDAEGDDDCGDDDEDGDDAGDDDAEGDDDDGGDDDDDDAGDEDGDDD